MSALGTKLRQQQEGRVAFWCPGCSEAHSLRVSGERRPKWDFNGDADAPTFSPSILVTWRDPDGEFADEVCHSFVRAGQIEFLHDCTHALAGQTLALPDWPEGAAP